MKKIVNTSTKDIPEELFEAIVGSTLTEVNSICEDWNLKISEIDYDKEDNVTYVISDRFV